MSIKLQPNKQKGLTLLEILITVVVFSIGLLGLAALQIKGTQFNHSAYLRSQASFLAYDILDRMRANRNIALTSGAYSIKFGQTITASTTNCNTTTASCSATQMAASDLKEWKNAVMSLLPNGDGEICFISPISNQCTSTPTNVYGINIRWQDSREDNASMQSFIFRAEL